MPCPTPLRGYRPGSVFHVRTKPAVFLLKRGSTKSQILYHLRVVSLNARSVSPSWKGQPPLQSVTPEALSPMSAQCCRGVTTGRARKYPETKGTWGESHAPSGAAPAELFAFLSDLDPSNKGTHLWVSCFLDSVDKGTFFSLSHRMVYQNFYRADWARSCSMTSPYTYHIKHYLPSPEHPVAVSYRMLWDVMHLHNISFTVSISGVHKAQSDTSVRISCHSRAEFVHLHITCS